MGLASRSACVAFWTPSVDRLARRVTSPGAAGHRSTGDKTVGKTSAGSPADQQAAWRAAVADVQGAEPWDDDRAAAAAKTHLPRASRGVHRAGTGDGHVARG